MNSIKIKDLRVPVKLGCTAEERAYPQIVVFNLEIICDLAKSVLSDRLEDTICYVKIIKNIESMASDQQWALVEKLCHDCAQMVLDVFAIAQTVKIEAEKRILANVSGFSVNYQLTR